MSTDPDFSCLKQRQLGLLAALGAYLWWGVITVIYIHHIRSIRPIEIIGHRIIWSLVVLLVLIALRGQFGAFLATLRSQRKTFVLLITAVLITINWLLFTYAVQIGDLVQASLGYFSTPLVNVALGLLVLRERLRPLQWVAVALGIVAMCVF